MTDIKANDHIFNNEKVKQGKYTVDSLSQEFFYEGFVYKNFNSSSIYNTLYKTLKALFYESEVKENFKWKEKYYKTYDLFPNTFSYDDNIIDFLFDQQIPELLRKCMGTNLYLGDVTFRKTLPGKGSYMGWHRDTYEFFNKTAVGRTPPLVKLIYYPSFDEKPANQIYICKGSHLRYSRSKILDRAQTVLTKPYAVKSSNDSFLLFNTFLYHGAAAQKNPKGGARLIYNFCKKEQLSQFEGRQELHKLYQHKLNTL